MSETLSRRFINYREVYRRLDDQKLVNGACHCIETLITKVLKKYFLPSLNGRDELFDRDAALEPCKAKIHVAYRIGLISQGLMEDMLAVRNIRKMFRGTAGLTALDNKSVSELCDSLLAPERMRARSKQIKEDHFSDSPRGRFEATVVLLSALLEPVTVDVSMVQEEPFY